MAGSSRYKLITIALIAAALGFALIILIKPRHVATTQAVAPFSLTDTLGHTFTQKNLQGKTSLIFFGFTHCPDMCPATLAILSEALEAMPEERLSGLQPLFVTVDPGRDDTDTIAAYLTNFHPSIIGLTGQHSDLNVLTDAVKAYALKEQSDESGSYNVQHSGDIIVMNTDGIMIGKFPYGTSSQTIVDYLQQLND